MLKLTVVDLQNDRRDVRFGSAKELSEYLQGSYMRIPGIYDLDEIVATINASELFHVEVVPYEPGVESNRLPPDYLTASSDVDVWPRAGDMK